MQKINTVKGFLCCLFVCLGITLFLVAPVSAGWTDPELDTMLIIDTEVSVLGQSSDPLFPGMVELPVFDGDGVQQEQIDVFDVVKIEATLTVTSDMPLPIIIRIVFGGLSYKSAPRTWTLYSEGTYSTSTYILASTEGDKNIGAKAWVKWIPEGETSAQIDNITILDSVHVGP